MIRMLLFLYNQSFDQCEAADFQFQLLNCEDFLLCVCVPHVLLHPTNTVCPSPVPLPFVCVSDRTGQCRAGGAAAIIRDSSATSFFFSLFVLFCYLSCRGEKKKSSFRPARPGSPAHFLVSASADSLPDGKGALEYLSGTFNTSEAPGSAAANHRRNLVSMCGLI